ncbi:putative endopeptidase precursor [Corynebacterium afermentans subsp. afermentans]|uniref:NlpC/P60 family protein n=1 Tax=Corynebacterium afermentans TaxID=38286 RepID=A0A9X8R0V6_9CORY|nr:putative endopeptidase precursor [Corynebacterium afermentans subsp. afermentans]SIP89945.1 NlpC/P60 family protein [Corynebacterium afermentans]
MEKTIVAKHRRQNNTAARAAAATVAVAAGAALVAPAASSAAEVRVPTTPVSAQVPGIENVPGITSIPGIDAWIPSLAGAPASGNVQNAIASVKAMPGVANVPGFSQFLANVEQQVRPAAPAPAPVQQTYSAPVAAPAPAPEPSAGERIVSIAQSKIGSPYVYGAAGPNAFDCSGFTSWVYAQAGKSIPRTSQAQAAAGQQVALSDIQPGDIVAYYGGASHVAIYAGNGQIIDALNSGIPVGYRDLHMMPIHSVVRF